MSRWGASPTPVVPGGQEVVDGEDYEDQSEKAGDKKECGDETGARYAGGTRQTNGRGDDADA